MENWCRPGGRYGNDKFHLIACGSEFCDGAEVGDSSVVELNLKDFGSIDDVTLIIREGLQCSHVGDLNFGGIGTGCLPGLCNYLVDKTKERVFQILSLKSQNGEDLRPSNYSQEIVAAVKSIL